jgi:DNA-binding CsgD family transcriptional regulator
MSKLAQLNNVNLTYQKKVAREVLEICKPIFDFFKINFFSHTRAFHNGEFTCLLTSTELTEYYLNNKFPINFSAGKGFFLEAGYYLANHISVPSSTEIRKLLCENFNTDHFLYIIDKQKNYDDMYALATRPENDAIINQYLNEREFLQYFILYYKDKASTLLKNADTVRYSKEYFPFYNNATILSDNDDKCLRQTCMQDMILNKIYISGNEGEVSISKREFDCLQYIVKNYTLKEIGKHLSLSPRTVETYLNNLKRKLGCNSRSQLIDIVDRL